MSKSAQAKLLFLISCFTQNPSDWLDVFSSPLPRLKGYPKRDKTIKRAIESLIKDKKIEFKKDKEKILIRPSKEAFENLSGSFPFYKTYLLKWDGNFRFIMYDVSESQRKERDKIRYVLKINRLGMWQNSLWVSPYPVPKALSKLKELGFEKYLQVFEAKLNLGDVSQFVNKIWQMDKLNEAYQKINKELEHVLARPRSKKTKVEVFRRSFLSYEKLLSIDPGLPGELLPKNWYGMKVRRGLKRLQQQLK